MDGRKCKESGTQEKRRFYQKIAYYVFPIAVQNLLAALVGVADTLMLGMLDQNALSAVSLATQVQFVLNLFFSAMSTGITILAAQYWGKGDRRSMKKLLSVAIRISCVISVIFFGAVQLLPGSIMHIFTPEEELIAIGIRYLRIAGWSYLLMAVPQVYLCMMKNSGRVIRSTLYGFAAVVCNILLNGLLIFGLAGFPALGVEGAAIATVAAIGVELLLVLAENMASKELRMRRRDLGSFDLGLCREFFHYSIPVLADLLVWGLGFTAFSIIIGHMGNDAVAANSIANTARSIISCFCLGLGSGTGIILGNELGKNDLDTAKEYGNRLLRTSVWTGILSGILLVGLSPLFLSLSVSLDEQSLAYLRWMLLICGFYIVGKSINVTLIDGVFCAGGDTRFGFWCDLIIIWLLICPIGAFAAFGMKWSVPLVYLILSMDEYVKIPLVYRRYRKYRWLRNLTG